MPGGKPNNNSEEIRSLKEKMNKMNSTIIAQENKMNTLRNDINSLKEENKVQSQSIELLASQLIISGKVSELLVKEIDTLSQYSRRPCLVLRGIPTSKNESLNNVVEKVNDVIVNQLRLPEAARDIDKAHRVGPRNGTNQNIIVNFKSHEQRYAVYQKRSNCKR